MVDFIDQAMIEGAFTINRTSPPKRLKAKSTEYSSSSTFDYCLYATALGYLDFCVGLFTVTNQRAATANFYVLTSEPLYLYIFGSETEDWKTFLDQLGAVFAPFSTLSWFLIFLVFLPIISTLFVFHEFKTPLGDQEKSRYIHLRDSFFKVCYGFLAQSYPYPAKIVTLGGKLTLMGFAFFILVIVATYTANLAAIFFSVQRNMKIESLDDAIRAGYTFCGARKTTEQLMKLYDNKIKLVPGE